MKALSVWQPWATAIALGSKCVETRSWSTRYRGPMAIHASTHLVRGELAQIAADWMWCGALDRRRAERAALWDTLPFGAIVAVCTLADCRPTDSFTVGEIDMPRRPSRGQIGYVDDGDYDWTERSLGDFSPGRFGWVLSDIKRLDRPIPYMGKQGLFEVPNALLAAARTAA